MFEKEYVLSIGGYDPCAGAGVLSDVKTMESIGVYGLAVTTCITYQNDSEFRNIDWLSFDQIKSQLDVLFDKYEINIVKIGLIQDIETLERTIDYLHDRNEDIFIIWDPILKASAGFEFHSDINEDQLSIIEKIDLMTPNKEEALEIFGNDCKTIDDILDLLEDYDYPAILIKSWENKKDSIVDILIDDELYEYEAEKLENFEKHGTGCVMSSVIASLLALDTELEDAVDYAKSYLFDFMSSNPSRLGYHKLTLDNNEENFKKEIDEVFEDMSDDEIMNLLKNLEK